LSTCASQLATLGMLRAIGRPLDCSDLYVVKRFA